MGMRLSWVPVLDPLTIWVILANYLISLSLCVFIFLNRNSNFSTSTGTLNI